jgi:pimeloyl-ACP methyl ester carboxylesterase
MAMIVDVVRAESSRFRNPLLFVHGLWTGGWIWRQLGPYLAHRGWDSWAPSFLDDESPPDVSVRLAALLEICRALPAPPVLIAHDAGVGMAAVLAREIDPPAIVAIAPLSGGFSVFRYPQLWRASFATRVAPPGGSAATRLFSGVPADDRPRLRPDSGRFVRALASGRLRVADRTSAPGLVLYSEHDAVVPVRTALRLAARRAWSVDVHESAGHFPMLAPGWEQLAARVHRWLVQAIGADLLVWLDDERGEE